MGWKDERWEHLEVDVGVAAQELVAGMLFERGCLGIHEEELSDARVRLNAYFDVGQSAPVAAYLQGLKERDPVFWESEALTLRTTTIPGEDWALGWRKYFKSLRIGDHLVVSPTWEKPSLGEGDHVIWIDPGMAFGTGTHATTQLCLAEIERIVAERTPRSFLDVGCGSAILSIAAAKLGIEDIVGVDIDEDALEVAAENLSLNKVAVGVSMSSTPIEEVEGEFDLVVANILAHFLVPMAPHLRSRLAPGGTLVLSGILATQLYEVERAYRKSGFRLVAHDSIDPPTGDENDRWVMIRFEPA